MSSTSGRAPRRVVILGAAGRDFHDFNVVYRDDPTHHVVAFTATQIPNIAGRRYPPELAGARYPAGIPILAETDLDRLLRAEAIDEAVFAYSDVAHADVMHVASRVLAAGADFRLLGPRATMLAARRPVVSVCAVRTGCGKSPVSRRIAALVREAGLRVAVVRHPMPYGDLAAQAVQRFATLADMEAQRCTVEEMEEYEPHIAAGGVVFAGVDYAKILRAAEEEADIVLWDGGNNDLPFFVPDLSVVLVDPHRPGHERGYFPGETNFLSADVLVLSKVGTADPSGLAAVRESIRAARPAAVVVETDLRIVAPDAERLRGARVLVVEDGPTLTHGGMGYGAGTLAAREHGAILVDPRPYAVGSIARAFAQYGHLGAVLPALGYGGEQVGELERTIAAVPCDVVVVATPVDLRRILRIDQPVVRVTYDAVDRGEPTLTGAVRDWLARVAPR